jgi:hypothetical protein
MAISFVGNFLWGNVGGSASGVATSGVATLINGDGYIAIGYMVESGGSGGFSLTWSGSGGQPWTQQGSLQTVFATDFAQCGFQDGTAKNETITLTGAGTGVTAFWVDAFSLEYRGVQHSNPISSVSNITRSAPGTGSGAITGTAVSVPTGSILLALCINRSNHTNAISSPTGTVRASGTSTALVDAYCITEYAGAGSNITPTFTDATNGGTDLYGIVQFIVAPSSVLADDADVSVFQWIQEANETGDELWEAVFDSRPVDPLKIGQFFNTEVEM